jgi:hypothetical protein
MEEVYLIARYFYFKTAAGNARRYFTGGTKMNRTMVPPIARVKGPNIKGLFRRSIKLTKLGQVMAGEQGICQILCF